MLLFSIPCCPVCLFVWGAYQFFLSIEEMIIIFRMLLPCLPSLFACIILSFILSPVHLLFMGTDMRKFQLCIPFIIFLAHFFSLMLTQKMLWEKTEEQSGQNSTMIEWRESEGKIHHRLHTIHVLHTLQYHAMAK